MCKLFLHPLIVSNHMSLSLNLFSQFTLLIAVSCSIYTLHLYISVGRILLFLGTCATSTDTTPVTHVFTMPCLYLNIHLITLPQNYSQIQILSPPITTSTFHLFKQFCFNFFILSLPRSLCPFKV